MVHDCHGQKCQDSKLRQPEGQQGISMVIKEEVKERVVRGNKGRLEMGQH